MKQAISIKLPYGCGSKSFSLPNSTLLGVLQNNAPRTRRLRSLVSESIKNTVDNTRLERLLIGKKKILVVVPDSTRKAHLKDVLPILLRTVSSPSRKVDIIIATGLHKKHSKRQLWVLLGRPIINHYRVINHEQDKKYIDEYGYTNTGVPITLDKRLRAYDFIISVGVIEPHLYAGYSGGPKTIAIGLAGEPTINATHSVRFLDNPLTGIGSIRNNPFHASLLEIIKHVCVGFCLNIVNDPDGYPLKVFSGSLKDVFGEGVKFAKEVFEVSVKTPCDIAVCGIGFPKDINLYQASRALNYVLNVNSPIVKKGGFVIVVAELKEGVGNSTAEERFHKELKKMTSPKDFVLKIKRNGCVAGEHRAYMVAKAMLDYKVILVTESKRDFVKGLPFPVFDSVAGAVRYAESHIEKRPGIYVIPRALSTIAVLKK
ncbi:MAG: nickel-dependent lactate racemase [Candidatus Omnitrophica bacterium]|nr:nickel-dependent lactate racemase [Candidatus Omnitrophota bacterium]